MRDYADFTNVNVCADCLMVSEGYDAAELGHEPAPTDAAEWIVEPLEDYAPHYGRACDFCFSPRGLGDTYKARAERRSLARAGDALTHAQNMLECFMVDRALRLGADQAASQGHSGTLSEGERGALAACIMASAWVDVAALPSEWIAETRGKLAAYWERGFSEVRTGKATACVIADTGAGARCAVPGTYCDCETA